MKKQLLILLAGVWIGTGVGTILYANIGSDTVSVFQDGMHVILHISYGQASRIYNGVLIVLAFLSARKYLGLGTVLSALVTSIFIDGSVGLLVSLNLPDRLPLSFLLFAVGQTIYTMGLALLINCKLGMNALDSLLYQTQEWIKVDYKWLRLGADFLLTLLGWIMGGVCGIGTLLSILLTGVMIEFFVKWGEKWRLPESAPES